MDGFLDYSRYFWQSNRVRLRPLRIEDAEQSFASSLDSPSRQLLQLSIELPTSVDLLKVKLEKYVGFKEADGVIVSAVEDLAGDGVGAISLHSCDEKNGVFSFGIVIYRQLRGQGYAEEAVRILLKYGFWKKRYQKCNSTCLHVNEASIRMHQKSGFLEEGRHRRVTFFNGEYYDSILFGMLREEFDAQQQI
jgi:RimJ/RimL family protein N-acetyltransferase